SVDAKNQNEPSETKPPIIHNLSHHFSFGKHLMVANAGDGRAVLRRNGEAIDMSQDHKPIYLP
ncbi:unnamed protein product, partial [Brassica oleracea var. botrytis]